MSVIEATTASVKRYWYEDGLAEIGAGVIFLAVAALFAFESAQPEGSPLSAISAIGLPIVVIGGIVVVGRAVTAAKRRLTYPRTGYVAYRKQPRRARTAAVLVATVVAVVLVAFIALSDTDLAAAALRWLPALDGLAIAAMYLYLGYALGIGRFVALAVVSLAAGLFASYVTDDTSLGTAICFGLSGTALIVSGGLTLAKYMRLADGAEGPGTSSASS
ncbi:MAG: hypothetical protein ACK2UL_03490 [Anaerolineae bacterium]